MGKPKSQTSRARKLAKKQNQPAHAVNYSIEELLEKASGLLDECQFELAEKFCQRALEISGDHPQALEMSANLLIERGEVEKAQHCLGRAITVQPEIGSSKYLTAAQLFSGAESRAQVVVVGCSGAGWWWSGVMEQGVEYGGVGGV